MRRQSGFSLLETLFALAILIITVIFIFNIFPATHKGMIFSENQVNAALLGKSLLDNIRSQGFDAAVPASGSKTYTGTDNGAAFVQVINYNVNVSSVTAEKKLIWVVLSWNEATGNRQITLETILTKR